MIETALVKDVPTIQQIFENLLEWGLQEVAYLDYADSMIKLGDIAKAR